MLLAENLLLGVLEGPSVAAPVSCPAPSGSCCPDCSAAGLPAKEGCRETRRDGQSLGWYLGSSRWRASFCCWKTDLFQQALVSLLRKALGESGGRGKKMTECQGWRLSQASASSRILANERTEGPFPVAVRMRIPPVSGVRVIVRHGCIPACSGQDDGYGGQKKPPLGTGTATARE